MIVGCLSSSEYIIQDEDKFNDKYIVCCLASGEHLIQDEDKFIHKYINARDATSELFFIRRMIFSSDSFIMAWNKS
jgi:hypothetical protein